MARYTNAYLIFRKKRIDPSRKIKMTIISKETASKWREKNDSQKRKHFHAAAKDAVDKEIASGRNNLTKKSFEQHGTIAFVNETPITKTENRLVETKMEFVQTEESEVRHIDVNVPNANEFANININFEEMITVTQPSYLDDLQDTNEAVLFDLYINFEGDNNTSEMINGVPPTEYL
ncbi:20351_t:CDS:1 [Funneliformis geosporum]|uniref:5860_t:CDS:1 n=1 Tax=Funneliformis geosporum TaxID=1117311 RepID=A0A9W4X3Y9_9GLOM|nr:5860_t:CDS:1 [Funneliformis geosporum]CAI2191042.1 20351_t:CDS:1 [Funneliformis geosporum]